MKSHSQNNDTSSYRYLHRSLMRSRRFIKYLYIQSFCIITFLSFIIYYYIYRIFIFSCNQSVHLELLLFFRFNSDVLISRFARDYIITLLFKHNICKNIVVYTVEEYIKYRTSNIFIYFLTLIICAYTIINVSIHAYFSLQVQSRTENYGKITRGKTSRGDKEWGNLPF